VEVLHVYIHFNLFVVAPTHEITYMLKQRWDKDSFVRLAGQEKRNYSRPVRSSAYGVASSGAQMRAEHLKLRSGCSGWLTLLRSAGPGISSFPTAAAMSEFNRWRRRRNSFRRPWQPPARTGEAKEGAPVEPSSRSGRCSGSKIRRSWKTRTHQFHRFLKKLEKIIGIQKKSAQMNRGWITVKTGKTENRLI
jgi:hypothetical protein